MLRNILLLLFYVILFFSNSVLNQPVLGQFASIDWKLLEGKDCDHVSKYHYSPGAGHIPDP